MGVSQGTAILCFAIIGAISVAGWALGLGLNKLFEKIGFKDKK